MKKTNNKTVSKKREVYSDDSDDEDEILNLYELEMIKPFLVSYDNPNYDEKKFPLKHPFMGALIGSTGSGKTNILGDMIDKFHGTFHKIYVFCANKDEPIYRMLEHVIPDRDLFEVFEGYDKVEEFDFDNNLFGQSLLVFDDFVTIKDQSKIENLYTRARKLGDGGASCLYLSQSFFDTPLMIRKNCRYIFLKMINNTNDMNLILRDCGIEGDKRSLDNMFNYCVKNQHDIRNMLFIDRSADKTKRYRKNYKKILNIDDFKKK